ncbi:MAG: hypothetical protein ABFS42_15795 [Candidatus Krumholzibacteriota bacterium]
MKRNIAWILVVVVVGIISWNMGKVSARGFEFTVQVSDTGVQLVSNNGTAWSSASYSGAEREAYAFVVSESGVRTPGVD